MGEREAHLPIGEDGQIDTAAMRTVDPEVARKLAEAGWGGIAGSSGAMGIEIPQVETPPES